MGRISLAEHADVARILQASLRALPLLLLAACGSAPPASPSAPVSREEFIVGGPCRYATASGFARVMNVAPEGGNVRVEFALSLPSGFHAPAWFRGEDVAVLFEGPRGALDDGWLTAAGLVPGAGYAVQISVITDGTCTPVIYRFPGRPWTVL